MNISIDHIISIIIIILRYLLNYNPLTLFHLPAPLRSFIHSFIFISSAHHLRVEKQLAQPLISH